MSINIESDIRLRPGWIGVHG